MSNIPGFKNIFDNTNKLIGERAQKARNIIKETATLISETFIKATPDNPSDRYNLAGRAQLTILILMFTIIPSLYRYFNHYDNNQIPSKKSWEEMYEAEQMKDSLNEARRAMIQSLIDSTTVQHQANMKIFLDSLSENSRKELADIGYNDAIGRTQYNNDLWERRAKKVASIEKPLLDSLDNKEKEINDYYKNLINKIAPADNKNTTTSLGDRNRFVKAYKAGQGDKPKIDTITNPIPKEPLPIPDLNYEQYVQELETIVSMIHTRYENQKEIIEDKYNQEFQRQVKIILKKLQNSTDQETRHNILIYRAINSLSRTIDIYRPENKDTKALYETLQAQIQAAKIEIDTQKTKELEELDKKEANEIRKTTANIAAQYGIVTSETEKK